MFLFITIPAKLQNLLKVYRKFGVLVELIVKTIYEIYPFLVVFFMWDIIFAFIFKILGAYHEEAEGFPLLNNNIGYFFISFGNSIGNIQDPSFDDIHELNADHYSFLIIGQVYCIWFVNQIFLNIILLNFVIALVAQVYENVMDSKIWHVYKQRQDLNDESDNFFQFFSFTLSKYMSTPYLSLPKPLFLLLDLPNIVFKVTIALISWPCYRKKGLFAWILQIIRDTNHLIKYVMALVLLPIVLIEYLFKRGKGEIQT